MTPSVSRFPALLQCAVMVAFRLSEDLMSVKSTVTLSFVLHSCGHAASVFLLWLAVITPLPRPSRLHVCASTHTYIPVSPFVLVSLMGKIDFASTVGVCLLR